MMRLASSPGSRQLGFAMAETMASISLLTVLVVMLFATQNETVRHYAFVESYAEDIRETRRALHQIEDSIRRADAVETSAGALVVRAAESRGAEMEFRIQPVIPSTRRVPAEPRSQPERIWLPACVGAIDVEIDRSLVTVQLTLRPRRTSRPQDRKPDSTLPILTTTVAMRRTRAR